jgi:hypothetical protein
MSEFKKELMKITRHSRMLVDMIEDVRKKYPNATETVRFEKDGNVTWVVEDGDTELGSAGTQWEAWQEAWNGIYCSN